MAKVTLAPEFESLSGKLCSRSKSCIALNKHTGKMVRYDVHEHRNPNTAKQQAVRATFTQKSKVAASWWKTNKPVEGAVPTADYQRLEKAYQNQHEIGSIYNYLRACVTDEMKIVIAGQEVTNFVPDQEGLG